MFITESKGKQNRKTSTASLTNMDCNPGLFSQSQNPGLRNL